MARSLCAALLIFAGLECVVRVSSKTAGSYGGLCVSECKLYEDWCGSYYTCQTTSHDWDYCSPVAGTGALGGVCKPNSQCGKHGYGYSWCYTESGSWDYCSENVVDIVGAYGGVCTDTCKNDKSTPYSYCTTTMNGWDYCSLKRQTGAKGVACKPHHPCGHHGWWYSWCYTDDGSWDYCSVYPSDFTTTLTRYGHHCTSKCQLHDSSDKYFYCFNYHDWDYCSPKPHATHRKVSCNSNHYCDSHGYDYYWCYTSKGGSWDYCSPIENCAYWPPRAKATTRQVGIPSRRKRRTKRKKRKIYHTTCHVKGNPHHISFSYAKENCTRLMQPSYQQQKEGEILIGKWKLHSLKGGQKAETLYKTENMRIDTRNTPLNGLGNLMIQTQQPACDTIASLLLPVGERFPLRHIRRALSESLNRTVEITIKSDILLKSAAGHACISNYYVIMLVLMTILWSSLWDR